MFECEHSMQITRENGITFLVIKRPLRKTQSLLQRPILLQMENQQSIVLKMRILFINYVCPMFMIMN